MKRHLTSAAALTALLLPGLAYGAGFQLNDHGASGTGKAGASIATVLDASAVYHNTAALTRLEGTHLTLGVNIIFPKSSYEGAGFPSTNPSGAIKKEQVVTDPIPVPHFYLSHRLTDSMAVGLGVYNHYGLGLTWQDDANFIGRTIIQELSLRTFYITPAFAYQLNDHLRLGVALNLVPGSLYIRRVLGSSDNGEILFSRENYSKEGSVEINGSAFGVGGIAALQVSFLENWMIGVSYKSAVKMAFSGKAHFDLPAELPASIRANFPDQNGSGQVILPHTVGVGIGYEEGGISVEGAVQLTTWQTYDELRIKFGAGKPQKESVSPREWKATTQWRLGGEYRFPFKLTLRGGMAYDETPAPTNTVDPTMPDSSRFFATLGAGYQIGFFTMDLAYLGAYAFERTVLARDKPKNFAPGTYGGAWVHILALSFSTSF